MVSINTQKEDPEIVNIIVKNITKSTIGPKIRF